MPKIFHVLRHEFKLAAAREVLLAASVAGMALLAAKIFRVGILMTGKRAKLGEILRWITVK